MLNRLARVKRAKTQLPWATWAVSMMLCISGCHWVGGAVVIVQNVGASPLHQVQVEVGRVAHCRAMAPINHSSLWNLFDAGVNLSMSSCVL